ncbi:hypothetical protein KSC_044380 [Ktedonobacter sp. SOSP1-52]|uniref:NACHT domain-containing protein n=1 Tax=Ktedonobacter sp. SOSP1-52 TaxID=2778366 RepID=UPI001915427B|nr:ATP-binding protein [Ktedonobacter sp. SOSP1-52]GHO65546.1 hypothetical protein KSC_044380 [Ktedonobacter sp. SOSP1-52]
MPLPGGPADKFGNSYEGLWTVNSMIEIISGRALSICIEPLGPEGEGVEFWLQRRNENREYHQVKRQHSEDGRWTLSVLNNKMVLPHFRKKLCGDSAASCVFVSMHAAYQLDELADRARRSKSWREYRESCLQAEGWAKDFENLCFYWDRCSEQEAYEALQRIEVETISEKRLYRTVESHLDLLVERDPAYRSEGDAATARDILAQFALESIHHTLTAHDIWLRLENRGYRRRDWGNDLGVVASAGRVTERYRTQLRTTLIAGKVIPRSEVNTILQTLFSPKDRQGILLSAEAGAGKSGVLLQVVEAIRERGWPVLAFRVDRLEPVLDPEDIGRQLKLPGSPVTVLAALAQGRDCTLVLDQIDAVSTTSGRNPQFFDCIETLIQQAQTHPRMHLVLACRKFDLENDYRLRMLAGKDGIAIPLTLGSLDEGTVRRVLQELGLTTERLTQKQIALLSNPFHLSLLTGGAQTSPTDTFSFQTAKDLYYQFWDTKEMAVSQRLGYAVPWSQIMDTLAGTMSEQQRLFVTEPTVDQFRPAIKAMVSEHVLVQHSGQYAFFHESFFDYVFARRFAAQGRMLVPFLCESEQHLFRRAQVRQILLHERDIDRDHYLDDLRSLLTSPAIRFHLKQIVLALLAGLTDPTEEEWMALAPLLEKTADPFSQEIWHKLQYSTPWFCLLDALGIIERWLASQNQECIEQTILLLAHAQRQLPDRVAELVGPYIEEEEWHSRFVYIFQWADLGAGRHFFELFLRCIECGWLDETKDALASHRSLFWTLLASLPTQRPEWACEAIGRYFDRCLQRGTNLGETHPFSHSLSIVPYTFHGNHALMESATGAPLAFYRQVFPFMYMVMGLNVKKEGSPPWQDTVWGRISHHYGGGDSAHDALLSAMERALSHLAVDSPEDFEPIADLLQYLDFETAHYLLLRGYAANGTRFADAAANYLCNRTVDLAIGYGGDAHRVTRDLIEAITLHCSERAFALLEQRLLHYYTAYELSARSYKHRVYFGQPTLFGYAQLELLEGIAPFRRTRAITRRIAEWRRKFPDEVIEPRRSHQGIIGASLVGSPIPDAAMVKMTDKQWLRAISRHHHDIVQIQHNGALVGGVSRVSSQLERRVKEEPSRFAALVQAFPNDAHSGYFDAVLCGIAEAQIDVQAVLTVCRRCHILPDKPCGYWICTVLAKQAEFPLTEDALDMVAWYAVEGAQPEYEEWRSSVEESLDRRTDPITAAGRVSVRGNAAEVIAHLIYHDGGRIPFFLPILERMVQDPSIPVRSCVALALRAVLRYDRESALSLFSQLCETEDILLQTSAIEQFIAQALHTHFTTVEPILQRMLQSSIPNVTRVGARLICVASLVTEQARSLVERYLSGAEAQRMGMAEVLTLHLRLASFRMFCEQAIVQLFNDPSEKVRDQVATCFNEFEGGQLGEYSGLVEAFVQSQTFATNPYYLIHALENTTAKLPEITCLACETFFEMMAERGLRVYGQSIIHTDAVGKLLLRVYSQQKVKALQTRCLDLIDRMLQFGEYSLSQVLAEYDR